MGSLIARTILARIYSSYSTLLTWGAWGVDLARLSMGVLLV